MKSYKDAAQQLRQYWFPEDQKNKRRSTMLYFEDVNGCGHAIQETDIESIEQKEQEGNYFLSRYKEQLPAIEIDEATYKSIIKYLAKDFDEFWETKMMDFSDFINDDSEKEDNPMYKTYTAGTGGSGTIGGQTWTDSSGNGTLPWYVYSSAAQKASDARQQTKKENLEAIRHYMKNHQYATSK
jgi:hypothetical protein